MDKIFIKNVLDVENDYFKGEITYRVSAMYDVKYEDEYGEFYDVEHEMLEEGTISYDELKEVGGVVAFLKNLQAEYKISEEVPV